MEAEIPATECPRCPAFRVEGFSFPAEDSWKATDRKFNRTGESKISTQSAKLWKEGTKMAKTIFEEVGGTYTQIEDYLLPDLKLPEEEQHTIGVWGQCHRYFLKEYRQATYVTLITSGKLNSYLADIDQQAEEMFFRLVKQMAETEGITEQLKADNPMEWDSKMYNIQNRAMKIVNSELVYASEPAVHICTFAEISEPPKVFWKYYDLYRRKRISLSEYVAATGLSAFTIRHFLKIVAEKSPKAIEKLKQI